MATGLLPFQSTGIRSCADPGYRKPDSQHRKSASSRWWTPLFGWSSEPDYIDPDTNGKSEAEPGLDRKPSRSRLAPASFTEEKARKLRMLTTASHHEAMYHSAIASRLASDFSDRSDV